MGIYSIHNALTANYHLIGQGGARAASSSAPAAAPAHAQASGVQIATAGQQLSALGTALGEFEALIEDVRPSRWRAASATSASAIGFAAANSPTVMRSREEVNANPASFTPYAPAWSGSTAQAAIGGLYLGTQGTGTLTFRVMSGGTHGQDDLTLHVFDPGDDFMQAIQIDAGDPINQQYSIGNGLNLSLGAGEVLEGDTFTVDVVAGIPTSYSPSDPQWTGQGAGVTLDGDYDGAQGTGTLRFRVENGGTHGVDDLSIKVFDPGDVEIETLDVLAAYAIDREFTLSNGLSLTLAAGDLFAGAEFTVDVDDTVGTAVDTTRPLDGTGDSDARLQAGLAVVDGSFTLNGVAIAVSGSDTLQAVLERITQSAADVTASFDAQSEEVVLTRDTPGAAYDIVLGNDSSGFLAAVKLNGAEALPGDAAGPLGSASLASFGAIQSGNIVVNGVSLAIDVARDSLSDVLERITDSAAGVTARVASTEDHVRLVADSPTAVLTLDGGNTGLFAALNIGEGSYRARLAGGVSEAQARKVGAALGRTAGALNEFFAPGGEARPPAIDTSREQIRAALLDRPADTFAPAVLESPFGLAFDFTAARSQVVDFSPAVERRFRAALRAEPLAVQDFFVGARSSADDGLVGRLRAPLETARRDLQNALYLLGFFGERGLLVDRFA